MTLVTLSLFGKIEGSLAGGRRLSLRNRKSRYLLAYLALHRHQQRSRARLAEMLWGDRAEAQAKQSLRQALMEIRAAIGDAQGRILVADREFVELRFENIDVALFERLAVSKVFDDLAEASLLYRAPLIDESETGSAGLDTWIVEERERLNELACGVLEVLASTQFERGDAKAALLAARRLVDLDPFNEAGRRLVMQALAASGRRNDALAQYERFERTLRDELGVSPLAETRELRDSLRSPAGDRKAAQASLRSAAPEISPDKVSVAVRPFEALSNDSSSQALSRVLTDDLASALCRAPDLLVVHGNSAGGSLDNSIGRWPLPEGQGTDYLLQGSIQRRPGVIRVVSSLVEAATGSLLWSEKFDRRSENFLAVQDDIVREVLVALDARPVSGEKVSGQTRHNES